MVRDGAYLQAYNAQIAVDEGHQIIVAAALSNQGPDTQYVSPMLARVVENCDAAPARVTADAGYFSADNVRVAEHHGCEPFIAVGGGHRRDGLPDKESHLPNSQTDADYSRRPLDMRHARVEKRWSSHSSGRSCRGYQHVSFRSLLKNRLEWLLVCATHNILKLWRALGRAQHQFATA